MIVLPVIKITILRFFHLLALSKIGGLSRNKFIVINLGKYK